MRLASLIFMPSFRDIFLLGDIDILLFTNYVLNEPMKEM